MEEWVVEYWEPKSMSPFWKRSADLDIGDLPPMSLEEAMKKAKGKQIKNIPLGLKYRIRNTRTKDIIPAVMFL